MIPHRYWRINVLTSNGGSSFEIGDLALRASVGGANEVTSAFLSSTVDPGTNPASNAGDGSSTTYFASNATAGDLTVDFGIGNAKLIVESVITARSSSAANAPKTWTLDWSDDGGTWTTLHTVQNVTFTGGSSLTHRLVSLSMRNTDGSRFYSPLDLNFSYFSQNQPHLFTAPVVVGTQQINNTVSDFETFLPAGMNGFLLISNSTGTTTDQAYSFAAPITP